jgi:hypothetical protein
MHGLVRAMARRHRADREQDRCCRSGPGPAWRWSPTRSGETADGPNARRYPGGNRLCPRTQRPHLRPRLRRRYDGLATPAGARHSHACRCGAIRASYELQCLLLMTARWFLRTLVLADPILRPAKEPPLHQEFHTPWDIS